MIDIGVIVCDHDALPASVLLTPVTFALHSDRLALGIAQITYQIFLVRSAP